MNNDCPHCHVSLSHRLAMQKPMRWRRAFLLFPIPDPAIVCSNCGERLYANPHPAAQFLNAGLWIALAAMLYGIFSNASIVFISVAAVLFLLAAAAYWYVSSHTLRHWPAFRSAPQR